MINPDYIPPDVAFGLAVGLALAWGSIEARVRRRQRRRATYRSLDCLDGRHRGCATCNCECHR